MLETTRSWEIIKGPLVNTPAELSNKVNMADEQDLPMALVLLTHNNAAPEAYPGEVLAYHQVTRFVPRMGLAPTPWDNLGFAFMGDLIQGQAPPTVMWDTLNFHTVAQTHVLTVLALDQPIAAQPNLNMVGPFNNG